MGAEFYTLRCLPDLMLAKYSAEESGGGKEQAGQDTPGTVFRDLLRLRIIAVERLGVIQIGLD